MRSVPEFLIGGRIRLVAAFAHEGAARRLVHDLKYRGVPSYADLVARLLAPRLPPVPLVPIPRVWTRRLKYGVDPAETIATRLSRLMGVPVVRSLERPLHSKRRAGGDHSEPVGPFRVRSLPSDVILVDDVVTSGSTIVGAARSIGLHRVRAAAAANSAADVSSLSAS
jgi:predicted amidophosphoribosyltransferase